MAQFDFYVDTEPMANSVESVSAHINATTAAVIAMEAAVIKAETEAADYICENVDRGFFSLIHSQVSMKLAEYYNEMNAKLILLMEFAKSLAAMQERMEEDINRLKREYYKVFHGLDKALENRIYQVDKGAMSLADNRKILITGKMINDVATVVCMDNDAHTTSQMAITSRMKNKTSRAIGCMGENVNENQKYKAQIEKILENETVEALYEEYIPVIGVTERSMVMEGSNLTLVYMPGNLSKEVKNRIEAKALSEVESFTLPPQGNADKDIIKNEFYTMLNSSNLDARVANMAAKLFENGGCK